MLQRNRCPLQGGKGGTQKQNNQCNEGTGDVVGMEGEDGTRAPCRGAGNPTLELSCECEEGWRGDYGEGAQLPSAAPPPPLCPVFISACL